VASEICSMVRASGFFGFFKVFIILLTFWNNIFPYLFVPFALSYPFFRGIEVRFTYS
jgi:hypothetical protein